jgi:hypothetical protein
MHAFGVRAHRRLSSAGRSFNVGDGAAKPRLRREVREMKRTHRRQRGLAALLTCKAPKRAPFSDDIGRARRRRARPVYSRKVRSTFREGQRRSLFDSMSNHIAKSVNCEPAINSSATSTTVPTETALPAIRSAVSTIPSARPAAVITNPNA